MAIAVNSRLAGPYSLSAGETGPHSFAFPIAASTDLRVTIWRSESPILLTHGADYTVTGVGQSGGGQITLTNSPLLGDRLVIEGGEPIERQADADTPRLDAGSDINRPGDKMTRILQDLARQTGRAVSVQPGETGVVLQSASVRADRILIGGPNGELLAGPFWDLLPTVASGNEDWGSFSEVPDEAEDWGGFV